MKEKYNYCSAKSIKYDFSKSFNIFIKARHSTSTSKIPEDIEKKLRVNFHV